MRISFTNATGWNPHSLPDKKEQSCVKLFPGLGVGGAGAWALLCPEGFSMALWMGQKFVSALRHCWAELQRRKNAFKFNLHSGDHLSWTWHHHPKPYYDDGGCIDSSHGFRRKETFKESVFAFHLIQHRTSRNKFRGLTNMTPICGCCFKKKKKFKFQKI